MSDKNNKTESGKKVKTQKQKTIRTVCIASSVLAVVIAALLLIKPIAGRINNAVADEVPEGYKTYNASRYFFRFEYPENWLVKTDSAGFGFMYDNDTGLVLKAMPAEYTGAAPANNDAQESDNTEKEDNLVVDETAAVRIYYRDFKDGRVLNSEEAFNEFISEINAGLMYGENAAADYSFDKAEIYNGRNETFFSAYYTCKAAAEDTSDDKEASKGESSAKNDEIRDTPIRGRVFVAARSMAY